MSQTRKPRHSYVNVLVETEFKMREKKVKRLKSECLWNQMVGRGGTETWEFLISFVLLFYVSCMYVLFWLKTNLKIQLTLEQPRLNCLGPPIFSLFSINSPVLHGPLFVELQIRRANYGVWASVDFGILDGWEPNPPQIPRDDCTSNSDHNALKKFEHCRMALP